MMKLKDLPSKWRKEVSESSPHDSDNYQYRLGYNDALLGVANDLQIALPAWKQITKSKYAKIISRFFAKVNQHADNGCWEWTAHCTKNGYGRMKIEGKHKLAHRFSWEIHKGDIPEIDGSDYRGTCVLHRCDNRKCVNPDHLFLGTHKDNINDMMGKHRNAQLCGELQGSSKLNEGNVTEIRTKYQLNQGTQRMLAVEYGVDQKTIHNIVSGKTWRPLCDLDYPPKELK